MKIKGKMTYVPVSGGFWGILGEDGKKYRPIDGVSDEFQQEGLLVEANGKRSNAISIFMWGIAVELKKIAVITS